MGAMTAAVVVLATIEVGYFVKTLFWTIGSRLFRTRIHPLQSSTTYGLVTLRDIDIFLTHMNNARFLRLMDFGRLEHFVRCDFALALAKLSSTGVVGSSVIRYRKPVYLFTPFAVDTGIVYWDDRSVYYRQDIRTLHDNFIRATAYLKVTLIGCTALEGLEFASTRYKGSLDFMKDFDKHGGEKVFIKNLVRTSTPSHNTRKSEYDEKSGELVTSQENPKTIQGGKVSFQEALPEEEKVSFSEFFADRAIPADLASFVKFNEFSSIRMKADMLVNKVTTEAIKRANDKTEGWGKTRPKVD